MMPTHGWGAHRTFVLGSVTSKVLHYSERPVWTCLHTEHPPRNNGASCTKVVCAIDLGSNSARVLDWASRMAQSYRAELTVVHALPISSTGAASQSTARVEVDELQSRCGTHADVIVRNGDIAQVVHAVVREQRADILVIGRGVAAAGGRLRSNAYSIIRQSLCPVISV